MSEYPTGRSPVMLDEVIRLVEEGESLHSACWKAAGRPDELDIIQFAENPTVYWYLFDRLPTAEAQHLWVLRKNLEIERKRARQANA